MEKLALQRSVERSQNTNPVTQSELQHFAELIQKEGLHPWFNRLNPPSCISDVQERKELLTSIARKSRADLFPIEQQTAELLDVLHSLKKWTLPSDTNLYKVLTTTLYDPEGKPILRFTILNPDKLTDSIVGKMTEIASPSTKIPLLEKIHSLEDFWNRHDLVLGYYDMSLFHHAAKEWIIIKALVEGENIPVWTIGVPSQSNFDNIHRLSRMDFFIAFRHKQKDQFPWELVKQLLILHDIGKYPLGKRDHENRGQQFLENFGYRPKGFTLKQTELLTRLIGFNAIEFVKKTQR